MRAAPRTPGRLRVHRRVFARLRRFSRRLEQPFPLVDGNALTQLPLRGGYFRTMLSAIERARRTVDVEMYLWERDMLGMRFVAALRRAARRGLAVRVLADAYGAREVIGDPLHAVARAGADVRVYNPFRFAATSRFFHRTHKKLLVIDGEVAFSGGAGFSHHFSSGKRHERPWHDRMYELRGPAVRQLTAVFGASFFRWRPLVGPPDRGDDGPLHAAAEPAGSARVRVLRGFPNARDFQAALLEAVEGARRRIWLGTPYFVPRAMLKRRLRRALRRGVDVQVVVPAASGAHPLLWYASRRHYGDVLRLGGRMYEFGPEFYHAKLAVIDDDLALIGSSNLDAWSWRHNAELDIAVHDPDTVQMVASCFERDRARSREVTNQEHRNRSVPQRIYENVAGLFDRWL